MNWVLIDEIAIGPCPRNNNDLKQIKSLGIKKYIKFMRRRRMSIAIRNK